MPDDPPCIFFFFSLYLKMMKPRSKQRYCVESVSFSFISLSMLSWPIKKKILVS